MCEKFAKVIVGSFCPAKLRARVADGLYPLGQPVLGCTARIIMTWDPLDGFKECMSPFRKVLNFLWSNPEVFWIFVAVTSFA